MSGSKFFQKWARISSAGARSVASERVEARAKGGIHQVLVVLKVHQGVAPVEEDCVEHRDR